MRKSLRNIHYALLEKDDKTEATYKTPEPLIGGITMKVTPASESETQFADDGPFDVSYALGEIKVEGELAKFDLKTQALLLGHRYVDGVVVKHSDDQPPWLALGFMSMRGPGDLEFKWLFKGKFALVEEEFGTATNKPEYRVPKLVGTFIKRVYDDVWEVAATTLDEGFTPAKAEAWFAEVQTPPAPEETEGGEG